jgi:hypothetical protein
MPRFVRSGKAVLRSLIAPQVPSPFQQNRNPDVPEIVSSWAIRGTLFRFNASSIAGGKDGGAKGDRPARLLRLIAAERATTSADIRLTGCFLSEIFVRLVTAIHKRKLLQRAPFDCDLLQRRFPKGRQDQGVIVSEYA